MHWVTIESGISLNGPTPYCSSGTIRAFRISLSPLVGDRSSSARLSERFPTGALATLTADTPWVVLGPGRAQLRSLIVPSELGRL